MRFKRNDKGEFEEVNEIHVTPKLLILSKLEHIEEELQFIHKTDYENRLKADMVAMLTELWLEIEECVDGAEGSPQFEQGVTIARVQVVEMIQQKIDKLKGIKNESYRTLL